MTNCVATFIVIVVLSSLIAFSPLNCFAATIDLGNGKVLLDIPDSFQLLNITGQMNPVIKSWKDFSTSATFMIMGVKPPVSQPLSKAAQELTKSFVSAREAIGGMTQLLEFIPFSWGHNNSTSGFKTTILEYNYQDKIDSGDSLTKTAILITEKNGTFYILTFKIPFKNFDKIMQDLKPVIDSFEVLT